MRFHFELSAGMIGLLLILMIPLVACGGGEDPTPRPERTRADAEPGATERATGPTARATEEAGPTRQGVLGRIGAQPTTEPGTTSEPGATATPIVPICLTRRPDPEGVMAASQTSADTDKETLIALFESTGGESWDSSGTWAGRTTIGEWQGVTVDGAGRVVTLELSGLTGELPAGLADLASLTRLSIPNSQLTGELPPELGSLASLEMLTIQNSQLTGESRVSSAAWPV